MSNNNDAVFRFIRSLAPQHTNQQQQVPNFEQILNDQLVSAVQHIDDVIFVANEVISEQGSKNPDQIILSQFISKIEIILGELDRTCEKFGGSSSKAAEIMRTVRYFFKNVFSITQNTTGHQCVVIALFINSYGYKRLRRLAGAPKRVPFFKVNFDVLNRLRTTVSSRLDMRVLDARDAMREDEIDYESFKTIYRSIYNGMLLIRRECMMDSQFNNWIGHYVNTIVTTFIIYEFNPILAISIFSQLPAFDELRSSLGITTKTPQMLVTTSSKFHSKTMICPPHPISAPCFTAPCGTVDTPDKGISFNDARRQNSLFCERKNALFN
ncbi:MAG: hypothetical protein LBR91_01790 [Puniceicoccales bacterium]|jgi:hypothetical protein|nr:hypothetical protein [Puniceicoccales bacterium]